LCQASREEVLAIDRLRAGKLLLGSAAVFGAGVLLGVAARGAPQRVEVPVVMTETVTVAKAAPRPRQPARARARRRHILPNDPLSRIEYGAWAI
jgi:hypothetical protein